MTHHAGDDSSAGPLDLSVAIVCKNNIETIEATLESVRGLSSESVALDSGSTDVTLKVRECFGVVIHKVRWRGHIATKQAALQACSKRWILSIDSDEVVEPELARHLRQLLTGSEQGIAGARVNRKVWYAGRSLEHTFQPEPRLRLVQRADVENGRAKWLGMDPHDRLDVAPSAGRVVDLTGGLRHDSVGTMAAFMTQQVKLGEISAHAMLASGKRPSRLKLACSPAGQFIKQGVFKGAWRDGWRGWAAAASAAVASLAKHGIHAEVQGLAAEANRPKRASKDVRSSGGIPSGLPDAGHPGRTGAADRSAHNASDAPMMTAKKTMHDDHDAADAPASNDTAEASAQTTSQTEAPTGGPEGQSDPGSDAGDAPKKKRRRRRRRKSKSAEGETAGAEAEQSDEQSSNSDGGSGSGSGSKGRTRRVRRDVDDSDAEVFDQETTFRDLDLNDELLRALDECGFTKPTYIQKQLIPPALTGRDVLGQA